VFGDLPRAVVDTAMKASGEYGTSFRHHASGDISSISPTG
jgi:hypothetical protein